MLPRSLARAAAAGWELPNPEIQRDNIVWIKPEDLYNVASAETGPFFVARREEEQQKCCLESSLGGDWILPQRTQGTIIYQIN